MPPSVPTPPRSRRATSLLGLGTCVLIALAALLASTATTPAAVAQVAPRVGYHATVLGWSSWYGSYDLGPAGTGWCIDHGLRAPDPAFQYVPAIAADLDTDRRVAMAWAVSAHVDASDPVESAAIMLVLHDLRGASYPFGHLDVDRLTPGDLDGFAGHEADVIARARSTKAEALAHRHLRAPFAMRLTLAPAPAPAPGPTPEHDQTGLAVATLTDANGAPVVGAGLRLDASGAQLEPTSVETTSAEGSVTQAYALSDPAVAAHFRAHALVPDPELAVLASSTTRAQRVARPAWLALVADAASVVPVTTSTTSTTAPVATTTTTAPPSTAPPTSPSTTIRPTPTTGPTAAPTEGPTSVAPESPAAPPDITVPGRTIQLPVTGGDVTTGAVAGLALIVLGASVVGLSRRRAA
jgi:hypothetical protein